MTPIFIVGVPRSGTTLVRSLMQSLGQVYLPPDEFQILPKILAPNFSREDLPKVLERSNFAGHMRRRAIWPEGRDMLDILSAEKPEDVCQRLFLHIAKLDGYGDIKYWGDKTPENIFHLDTIFATWPEARVIHILRDPRDTVLSMKTAWGRSLVRGSVIWRDGIREILRQNCGSNRHKIFELRYEGLTESPADELSRLSDWLGLPFFEERLVNFKTEERWSPAKSRAGIQNRGQKWRAKLSTDEIETIEGICFGEMAAFNYETVCASAPVVPSRYGLKAAKVSDALRVLQSYANERGWPAALSYKLRQWLDARKA